MDKKTLKLNLVQRLLLTENDAVLDKVKNLLESEDGFPNNALKKELDARKEKHLNGKSRSYSWDEVKTLAREALRK
ncbi:MAG: hypothetical protein SH857_14250 [Chitinophagales bacterium]|nr:hypothetical protein [Chitinophagales bacterium]